MNRRSFVVHSTAALAAAAVVPGAWRSLLAGEDRLKPLRDGAGYFTEKGGTIGWWIGKDGAFVIDTQFPDSAAHCLEGIRARTARKLDAVLITHHHGDHTAGIGTFKPDALRVVSHRNVPQFQKAAAEKKGNLADQVYPDALFASGWDLDLGGEWVQGRHFGPAHTGGDAVYHLHKANVVHVGDLVFRRMVPFVDRPGGASIGGWIASLDAVLKTYPSDTIYIYGHSVDGLEPVGDGVPLTEMRDYLSGLMDYVKKGKAAGKSVDELANVSRIPGFDAMVPKFEGAIKINVQAAWDELG